MKNGGCWIFLSHSSKDIRKVRVIRNAFEKNGQNPLAFHLRCLSTETDEGRAELDNLIKREIDAREWFVFCESEAAEASEYVRMEKDYIKNRPNKKIWTIDMSMSEKELVARVDEICRDITVFLSYKTADCHELVDNLVDCLVRMDFDVRGHQSLLPGHSWHHDVKRDIKDAANSGFIVVLLTERYAQSVYCTYELREIMKYYTKARIITIVIGGAVLPEFARHLPTYRIPHAPTPEDAHLLAELIEAHLKDKIRSPIDRYRADALNKIKEIDERLNYEGRYHTAEAELVESGDAANDYLEVYRFPCCGRTVVVGNGPVSRFRADGCACQDEKTGRE